MWQGWQFGKHLVQVAEVNPEFIFLDARRDVMVSVGVYIGIDSQGNVSLFVYLCGKLVDYPDFGQRFAIKAKDIFLQSCPDLFVAFPHSGINNSIAWKTTFHSPLYFIPAYAVGSQPVFPDNFQQHRISIGLDGIMDVKRRISSGLFCHLLQGFP